MNSTTVYDSSKPGHLFSGHESKKRRIAHLLRNGQSVALVGGRRCGKTSLLVNVSDGTLPSSTLKGFYFRYLSTQGLDHPTPAVLFESLYDAITDGLDLPPYKQSHSKRHYRCFRQQLQTACVGINQARGSEWVVVLLVDELDALYPTKKYEQFYQNLRHLLMESPYRGNLRLVASGSQGMASLISFGSPLNNLANIYLTTIGDQPARQLIQYGFPHLDPDTEDYILHISGRHPYVMQGILERCTINSNADLPNEHIDAAAKSFLREQPVFSHWAKNFSEATHCVCREFLESPSRSLRLRDLRRRVNALLAPELADAVLFLRYHGLIKGSDEEPSATCSLFWNWYQDRYSESGRNWVVTENRTGSRESSSANPQIHIEITQTAGAPPTISENTPRQRSRFITQSLTK